jgi:hypothetical protein
MGDNLVSPCIQNLVSINKAFAEAAFSYPLHNHCTAITHTDVSDSNNATAYKLGKLQRNSSSLVVGLLARSQYLQGPAQVFLVSFCLQAMAELVLKFQVATTRFSWGPTYLN